MRFFLQHIFAFCFFLFILHLERAMGLPFFSLALAALYLLSLPLYTRIILQLFLTGIVGVVYILPFTLIYVLLCSLTIGLEWQEVPYAHKAKFFFLLNVLAELILAFFLRLPITFFSTLLFGVSSILLFFFLTFWFEKKQKKQVMRLWKR
jgi:hypothetical protein